MIDTSRKPKRMNSDHYAKGWTQGREDALREARASLIRYARAEIIEVREALAVIDQLRHVA